MQRRSFDATTRRDHRLSAGLLSDLEEGEEDSASHPILAPLAWLACFALGAAFWYALIKLVFLR